MSTLTDFTTGPVAFPTETAPKIMSKYGYLDALNDLADIQFVDNTWDEGQTAKAEVVKIIKALCGF